MESHSDDSWWLHFELAERMATEALEPHYRLAETLNANTLNMIAGLDKSSYSASEGGPTALTGTVSHARILLQPDRRDELAQQNENPDYGDPFVIRRAVPPRTQQLLDDLLASTEATLAPDECSPGHEVRHGNVGGQPIVFDIFTGAHAREGQNPVKTLSVAVRRKNF